MHGINLALIIEGQEQVWIDALKDLGYTDPEVPSVACHAIAPTVAMHVQYGQNYGGPVPASIVKHVSNSGKRSLPDA